MTESTLDLVQAALVTGTLWVAGVGLGSSVRATEIMASLRRPRLLGRIMALDLVLIPLVMWVAVSLLVASRDVGTGLLLVAFASAGPLGIKLAQVAGGDVPYAIGVVVLLELANVAVVPLWASLLGIATSLDVAVDILRTLVVLVLLPIAAGIVLSTRRPTMAIRWSPPLLRLSDLGVAAIVVFLVVRHAGVVAEALTTGAPIAVLLLVGFALLAGWILGGPARSTRVVTSLVTGVRANGAAVAIAATAYAAAPGVMSGVIVAGVTSVVIPSILAYLLAARAPMAATAATSGVDASPRHPR